LEFDWNLSAGYEFELGSHLIDAGVDIPLSDTLAVRLSGQTSVQEGWIHNDATGNDVPHNETNAGRLVAVWTPNDRFDATFLYQQYKSEGYGLNEQYVVDLVGNARLRAEAAGFTGFETNFDRQLAATGGTFGDSDETNDGKRAILTLNYALGDFTLTSVSAYSEFTQFRANFDNDELPGQWTNTIIDTGNEQFTQELRLSSPTDQRLNYVVGLFYLNEDWRYVRPLVVATRNNLTPAQQPIVGSFAEDFRLNTSTISGFGQANYDLTDALTLSIGARVTNERRTADFFRETLIPGALTSVLYQAIAPTTRDIEDTNIDGSIGVQYALNADSLLYASYSRGTKSGGFISSPTNVATAYYAPEEADNYEIGGKFSFGRNIVNAAVFRTNVKDFQQTVFRGGAFQYDPQDLEAWGVEVESRFRLTDSLRVGGAVTYLQAERDNGTVPVNAPEWSGNLFANFEQPIGDNLLFSADAYLNFRSFVFYTVPALTLGYGPSTDIAANVLPGEDWTTLGGRVAIGSQDGRWQLALIGKNLTDEDIVSYARTATFVDGASVASIAQPRTISLQLSLRR
jgi:outer membrane receptor protein involved in Fe transport